MSGFERTWLELREPYDHDARSAGFAARFAAAVGARATLIDLGAGTGSNLRYLAPRLEGAQEWLLIDHDPTLARCAGPAIRRWALARGWPTDTDADDLRIRRPEGDCRVRIRTADLAAGLPNPPGPDGVTAAALLDLASAAWLDRLAAWCRGLPVLIALSVDGRLIWDPPEPGDQTVGVRFLAHQRRDKGFGPALGPDAPGHLARRLEECGHRVELTRADWRLEPADATLLGAVLEGVVAAAGEIASDRVLERWAATRRRQLAEGALRLTVGHVDLLALPD